MLICGHPDGNQAYAPAPRSIRGGVMVSRLRRLVDLRPGERGLALRAMAALFGLIAGHTILETARDTLFLGKLPASRLTLVYAALAGLSLVAVKVNAAFVQRFGR